MSNHTDPALPMHPALENLMTLIWERDVQRIADGEWPASAQDARIIMCATAVHMDYPEPLTAGMEDLAHLAQRWKRNEA